MTLVKFVVGWVVKILNLVRYFFHLTVSKLELSELRIQKIENAHHSRSSENFKQKPKNGKDEPQQQQAVDIYHLATFLGVT